MALTLGGDIKIYDNPKQLSNLIYRVKREE